MLFLGLNTSIGFSLLNVAMRIGTMYISSYVGLFMMYIPFPRSYFKYGYDKIKNRNKVFVFPQ